MQIPAHKACKRSDDTSRNFKKRGLRLYYKRSEKTTWKKVNRNLWEIGSCFPEKTVPLFCHNSLLEINHEVPCM